MNDPASNPTGNPTSSLAKDPVEAERQRIGAEIHDGLLPYLFAAAAKVSSLRRSLPEPNGSNQELSDSLAEVARWIDQSRQVARELMDGVSLPDHAVDDPLEAARRFLNSIDADGDCDRDGEASPQVHWNWSAASPLRGRLTAEIAAATYRIVCESVRNSVRHSQAKNIQVICQVETLANEQGRVHVEVRDDGCGIPVAIDTSGQVHGTSGQIHGLSWMKMRAAAAGIQLQIDSEANRGTSILLRLPAKSESVAG